MTEPVTADMLAEALREMIGYAWSYDPAEYGHRDDEHIPSIRKAESLIDRYDAQRRDDLNSWIVSRNGYMANARSAKWADATITASLEVAKARTANHRILHLRRELERHTNGNH